MGHSWRWAQRAVRKSHGTQVCLRVSTGVVQRSGPTQGMPVIVTTKYAPHVLSCLRLPKNPSLVPHIPEESSRQGKSRLLPSTAQQSWLSPSSCPGILRSGGGRQTYRHEWENSGQWRVLENPEINPQLRRQLTHDKTARPYDGEKDRLLVSGVGKTGQLHAKE